MRQALANAGGRWSLSVLSWALLLIGLIQLVPFSLKTNNINQVACQEFEDLNNQQQQTQGRRPSNGFGSAQFSPAQQQPFQLNNRQFGGPQALPIQAPTTTALAQQQQQLGAQPANAANSQRLSAQPQSQFQRSSIPSRFASTSSASSSAGLSNPQSASSQQQPVLAPVQPVPAATSGVDQIMKNALARTAKLEAESRQDSDGTSGVSSSASVPDSLQFRQGSPFQPQQRQTTNGPSSAQSAKQTEAATAETAAAASVSSASDGDGGEGSAQTTTLSSHETVYSDQRFANLFARRKTLNKAKFTPMETTRAKPTLPSFIKSPPDPKQFTASDGSESGPVSPPPRPAAAASSANLVAARPNRLNGNPVTSSSSQQKKANIGAITSNSAALANNKKTSALNGKPLATNQKPNVKDQKPEAQAKPISNNPFSRNNNNDPANVIAMARKRLLANNALESGKLKQQQQQQKLTSAN